jgi:Nucleotidyl transferase AbiEii toxin, Type IV TA system
LKYRDAASFRQALEQNLKDQLAADGSRIVRERKRIAFDRLLARLGAVAPERWLLKGGFALDLRLAVRARTTKDVDIEWRADEREMLEALLDATSRDVGDFFAFSMEKVEVPGDRFGGSHRFRISAALAGRPFESFLLDVGFRPDGEVRSEALHTDGFLRFAGIEPVEVRAVSLELQAAEKLHAYTRVYEGARPSTRVKDLVDLVLLAELAWLPAIQLREEIETIFAIRETHEVPLSLPVPPREWVAPYRRLAEEVAVSSKLTTGHQEAAALLDPILSGGIASGKWDPDRRKWRRGNS